MDKATFGTDPWIRSVLEITFVDKISFGTEVLKVGQKAISESKSHKKMFLKFYLLTKCKHLKTVKNIFSFFQSSP